MGAVTPRNYKRRQTEMPLQEVAKSRLEKATAKFDNEVNSSSHVA